MIKKKWTLVSPLAKQMSVLGKQKMLEQAEATTLKLSKDLIMGYYQEYIKENYKQFPNASYLQTPEQEVIDHVLSIQQLVRKRYDVPNGVKKNNFTTKKVKLYPQVNRCLVAYVLIQEANRILRRTKKGE